MYSDKEINNLIICPKMITKPPKKYLELKYGHLRNSFELSSETKKFYCYIRVCNDFQEDFSIGLIYQPNDAEKLTLVRYNGLHGEHTNPDKTKINTCHIHKASSKCIEENLKPEKYAYTVTNYATYLECLKIFCNDINIQDNINDYFKFHTQLSLL